MRFNWVYISLFFLLSATSGYGIPFHKKQTDKPRAKNQSKIAPVSELEPNLDGIVEVSFKVNAQGTIQILSINSTSPQLADYILKKLGKVQLKPDSSDAPEKVIKYSFVFKKQT